MQDNGFFQMPNYLWDMDLNIYQRAILTHIVRKTVGWGKIKDGISLSQFSKDLGISKPKVVSTLKELINMNLIIKKSTFLANGSQSYNLYFIAEKVVNEVNGVVNEINRGSKQDLQGVVNDINTQNTTNTKYTNTKYKEKNIKKEKFLELLNSAFKAKKILRYKDKINISKIDSKFLESVNLEELAEAYASYVKRNKNMSARLAKWLFAWQDEAVQELEYANNSFGSNAPEPGSIGWMMQQQEQQEVQDARILD